MKNPAAWAGLFTIHNSKFYLKFLVEVARRTRDVDSSRNAPFAIFDTLDDTRGLAALGTVGRLRRVHYLLAVASFRNLCHGLVGSPLGIVSAHAHQDGGGFNGAVFCSGLNEETEPGLAAFSLQHPQLYLAPAGSACHNSLYPDRTRRFPHVIHASAPDRVRRVRPQS
jgi:hypothetical protein